MKVKPPVRVLSVDWDYFVTHISEGTERPLWIETVIWLTRYGSGVHMERRKAPWGRINSVDELAWAFWPLVDITVRSLQAADSHEDIYLWLERWSDGDFSRLHIDNVDAHHDLGYSETRAENWPLNCGNWALHALRRGATVRQLYPRIKADAGVNWKQRGWSRMGIADLSTAPYDRVFVCRSGAWTPIWLDGVFNEFLGLSGLRVMGKPAKRAHPGRFVREALRMHEASKVAMLVMQERETRARQIAEGRKVAEGSEGSQEAAS